MKIQTERNTNNAELEIENAKIIYPNFSGKITRFNPTGFRTFNVVIPAEQARALKADGWNIKWFKGDSEDEESTPDGHLEVKIQYGWTSPKVVMVSGNNKTILEEETIGTLDFADIAYADLVIRPYHWSVNGANGIKPYLKTMYAILREDPFEKKHSHDSFVV